MTDSFSQGRRLNISKYLINAKDLLKLPETTTPPTATATTVLKREVLKGLKVFVKLQGQQKVLVENLLSGLGAEIVHQLASADVVVADEYNDFSLEGKVVVRASWVHACEEELKLVEYEDHRIHFVPTDTLKTTIEPVKNVALKKVNIVMGLKK